LEFEFTNKKLLKLYEKGDNSKLKLPAEAFKKFFMRIQQIEAAVTIYDLWKNPSLNYESLEGENFYSIRINDKYRIEFEVEWEDDEKTKGKFLINRVSKHYEG
jgi:plasmid maintenance system killer protein